MSQLEQQGILRSQDLKLKDDEDFIKLILAVVKAGRMYPMR